MALVSIPWHPSRRDLRIFAALQLVFFAVIAATLCFCHAACGLAACLLSFSVLIAIAGVLRPPTIRHVYIGWMLAVYPIGWVVSHVVIGLAYFGVITPIGWLLRLRGYDPMQRRFDPQATTYWQPRPKPPEAKRYFRQF